MSTLLNIVHINLNHNSNDAPTTLIDYISSNNRILYLNKIGRLQNTLQDNDNINASIVSRGPNISGCTISQFTCKYIVTSEINFNNLHFIFISIFYATIN